MSSLQNNTKSKSWVSANIRLEDVLKTFRRRLEEIFSVNFFIFQDVFKTCVCKTSWRRRLTNTSWRRLGDVLENKKCWKTSWKNSWRRVKDVLWIHVCLGDRWLLICIHLLFIWKNDLPSFTFTLTLKNTRLRNKFKYQKKQVWHV